MMSDKEAEYQRYNSRSLDELKIIHQKIETSGAESYPEYFRAPYYYYEDLIKLYAKPGTNVLDVCCGNGIHSLTAAKSGANVTATDIAENSLKIAEIRAQKEKLSGTIKFIQADAEQLHFQANCFDILTCAGSLSYVDLEIFMNQVLRLLKPGGHFIVVDSFNHNPIYRFNRYIHYLKGNRTLSTLNRMPSNSTLDYIRERFSSMDVQYFGTFSFLAKPLSFFIGEKRTAVFLDRLDKYFSFLRKYSFKIVIIATK